ncbi:hypothetical protein PUN28_000161 [Cardiocondyla obscurior]|uniref:Uncharacterized protein n=1 Tax=Cardiocondyla obscurior TaxID=286306 RepID=A0AAW2GY55_9HYME
MISVPRIAFKCPDIYVPTNYPKVPTPFSFINRGSDSVQPLSSKPAECDRSIVLHRDINHDKRESISSTKCFSTLDIYERFNFRNCHLAAITLPLLCLFVTGVKISARKQNPRYIC